MATHDFPTLQYLTDIEGLEISQTTATSIKSDIHTNDKVGFYLITEQKTSK